MDHPTTFPKLSPTTDHPQALLREAEVPREYGFSRPYLRKRRWLRLNPAYVRIGRMIFYERASLENFIAANRVEPGGPGPGLGRE